MRNISFDDPLWLLLAIPLLAALLIPFFISANKDNRSRGWIASLVLHVLIIACVVLAAGGLVYTTVMTRTKIYIVADVSHSASRDLDRIDEYISEIQENLPQNSRLGLVCFGRDSVILSSSGTRIKSVKEAVVDDSGTDIAAALDFTSTIFSEGELKRIILITDGADTGAEGGVIAAVERLMAKDIKLDTVYLDSNLKEGEAEVQISEAEYTRATYLGHETFLKLLVESNTDTDVMVDLYRRAEGEADYEKIDTTVLLAEQGINIVTFDLPTDVEGVYDYKAVVSSAADSTEENNEYLLTQTVAGMRRILLVTGKAADRAALEARYSDDAVIDSYVITDRNKDVPYTVEELSTYDEIVVSNVDIRGINNILAFIDSVDTVVSRFGKSLITLGDLYMSNTDDPIFNKFEELLPLYYGNGNKEEKLYTIILDVSRSMFDTSQLDMAKDAATKLVSVLEDDDCVIFLPFAGEILTEEGYRPMKLGDLYENEKTGDKMSYRQYIYKQIREITPHNGTLIASSLKEAYKHTESLNYRESQVMIISDGESFSYEEDNVVELAKEMYEASDIVVSTISILTARNDPRNMLDEVAEAGGGKYYQVNRASDVAEVVFGEIADNFNESIIEKQTNVYIERFKDGTVEGILSLPDVYGFVNTDAKNDASLVLSVDYQKTPDTLVRVPLYAYREHGMGRVSSFTSSLSGGWLKDWSDSASSRFFDNMLSTNTPKEYIDYPFDITFTHGAGITFVEILPSYLNPRAKATVSVTTPDGQLTSKQLAFDKNGYYTEIKTPVLGRYDVKVTYTYGTHSFTAETYFNVSYFPEYDDFTAYDIGNIYAFMRNVGRVYTDGDVDLTIDKNEVATYEYSFKIPLLAAAVALLVLDIFIRKTRWRDFAAFWRKLFKKGEKR